MWHHCIYIRTTLGDFETTDMHALLVSPTGEHCDTHCDLYVMMAHGCIQVHGMMGITLEGHLGCSRRGISLEDFRRLCVHVFDKTEPNKSLDPPSSH